MTELQKRIEQVENDLFNAKDALEVAKNRVAELEHDLATLTGGLDLPTEPGWYLNKHDQICRLTDDGEWDDGWGNGGYGYGHQEYATPLRKLEVVA